MNICGGLARPDCLPSSPAISFGCSDWSAASIALCGWPPDRLEVPHFQPAAFGVQSRDMATPTTPGNYDKSKTVLTTSLVVFAIVVVVLAMAWWFIRKPHFDGKTPVSISVLLHEPRPVNATSPPV